MAIRIVGGEIFLKDAEGGNCHGICSLNGRIEIEVPGIECKIKDQDTEKGVDVTCPKCKHEFEETVYIDPVSIIPPAAGQRLTPALILDRKTAGELAAVLAKFATTGTLKT